MKQNFGFLSLFWDVSLILILLDFVIKDNGKQSFEKKLMLLYWRDFEIS